MIIQEDSHSISLGRSTGFQDTEGLSGTEQISLGPSKQDGILGPASVHSCENSDTQRIRCEKIFRDLTNRLLVLETVAISSLKPNSIQAFCFLPAMKAYHEVKYL